LIADKLTDPLPAGRAVAFPAYACFDASSHWTWPARSDPAGIFVSGLFPTLGYRNCERVAAFKREAASMATKPIYPADLDRLARILSKAQLRLGLQKGSPELDQPATQIFALVDTIQE
jgi:hypothetical protein